MGLPTSPKNFSTNHIDSLVNFNVTCIIMNFISILGSHILHFSVLQFFHNNQPRWRVLVILKLFIFSLSLLINGQRVAAGLFDCHFNIIWFMSFIFHAKWSMNVGRAQFTDNDATKVFNKLFPWHIERTVFRTFIVVVLISELLCPFFTFKRPIFFPNSASPRIPQFDQSLRLNLDHLEKWISMATD